MGRGAGGCLVASVSTGVTFLLILIAVLVGVSFKSLEANEVGLDYDTFSQQINDRLYSGGTYFLGLAHKFVTFPTTQQSFTLATDRPGDGPALPARSRDGLPISISFSVNFRLRQTLLDLSRLYLQYGEMSEVAELYLRLAKNVVRTVASNYDATQFFGTERSDIITNMRLSLTVDLGLEGAILDSFNLYDIDVPAAFTDVRNRYLSAQQEISRAQNDRDVALIQAESNVQVAQREAQLIVSQALITAQSIQITTQAQIAALTARYDTESTSFSALKTALNLNTTELLAYIWLDAQAEGISTGLVRPLVNNAASLP